MSDNDHDTMTHSPGIFEPLANEGSAEATTLVRWKDRQRGESQRIVRSRSIADGNSREQHMSDDDRISRIALGCRANVRLRRPIQGNETQPRNERAGSTQRVDEARLVV